MQHWRSPLAYNSMPCQLYRCELPLLRPVSTARGQISSRTTWVVEIVTDSGAHGYGEAAPSPDSAVKSRNCANRC